MKKTLGILMAAVMIIVMAISMVGCGTSQMQSEIDGLKDLVADLTDKVDDLTKDNEDLTDKITSLNVFTADKAEYEEHETMTVYFKNQPVLKIRINFDNIFKTALFGGSVMNHIISITSLCADMYAETIVGASFVVSNSGTCVRRSSAGNQILKHNVEVAVPGQFACTDEAYNNSTWFDLVICVPGTPFELARFKNISHHD